MVQIYIEEVFLRYTVLAKIILNRDIKFILAFQQVLIVKQDIKIVVLIAYYLQTDG